MTLWGFRRSTVRRLSDLCFHSDSEGVKYLNNYRHEQETQILAEFLQTLPDKPQYPKRTSIEKNIAEITTLSGWKTPQYYEHLVRSRGKMPQPPSNMTYRGFQRYLLKLSLRNDWTTNHSRREIWNFIDGFLRNERNNGYQVILGEDNPEEILNPILWWLVKNEERDAASQMIRQIYNRLKEESKRSVEFYNILLAGAGGMCRYGKWFYLDRLLREMIEEKVEANDLTAQLLYMWIPDWDIKVEMLGMEKVQLKKNGDAIMDRICLEGGISEEEKGERVSSDNQIIEIPAIYEGKVNLMLMSQSSLDVDRTVQLLQEQILAGWRPNLLTVDIVTSMLERILDYVSCVKWLYFCERKYGLKVGPWVSHIDSVVAERYAGGKVDTKVYEAGQIGKTINLLRWWRLSGNGELFEQELNAVESNTLYKVLLHVQ
ncbi:hypothetical protein FOA43_000614 [Brettanomyces nanus]|uniref:Uncharacterized protein n=1 Tax=Eeniella nana TaxID=13502 RepID=A0A875S1N3_EENNA|nr:uncharacterized protein FOA43_000614 [Brettanomyces nanus]QPG73304.1 hypothetical protein FOA43_000614 [Brettanomyces nanus]